MNRFATLPAPHLARFADDVLEWRRVRAFAPESELRSGDEVLARLRLTGTFRRQAVAECEGARWRFVPRSFWSAAAEARDENGAVVARFRPSWTGKGSLSIEGGETYRWRGFGLIPRRYGFTRNGGDPLLLFRPRLVSLARSRCDLSVDADARRLPELPLLALFGWYLVLRHKRRTHAG